MRNNMKKPVKLKKGLFDFVYQDISSAENGQCIDADELESIKESVNQLRERLNLLIDEPECDLCNEEVLRVSQELDKLIHDYQKAYGYLKKLMRQQEPAACQHQDRGC